MKTKFIAFGIFVVGVMALVLMLWPQKSTQAQSYYSPAALSINPSNCVAGATTNTVGQTIDARGGKELCLGFTGHFLTTGVSNIVVTVTKSIDNVYFEPAAAGLVLTWVGNGTNVLTSTTNLSIGATPFFRVTVGNASASGFDCTNAALHYNVK